jgi:hypothetical protein
VRKFATLTLLAALAALTGCSGGSATPSPSVSTEGSPAEQLAALAQGGLRASYTATYALQGAQPTSAATVTIRRTPTAYRVDIVSKGSDAFLVRNPKGTYSCEQKPGKKPTCFTVAAAGKPIPPTFDAGVQKVFNAYLAQLATASTSYEVTPVDAQPATGALPEGLCYSVLPGKSSPAQNQVAAGTYCFSADGIPVHVAFPSGTIDLQALAVETPTPNFLVPPVIPTPLPRS